MAVEVSIKLGFRGKNLDAAGQAEKYAGELITLVSDESREAIRQLIVKSIQDGVTPYETARRIRDHIGMNRQQMAAAANYEQSLVEQGLSPANVAKNMEKFRDRQIAKRGLTIARYEIMNSLNQATLTRWLNDKEAGRLSGLQKQLVVADIGEWPCEICEPLRDVQIDIEQPFRTIRGDFTTPPFHPRCRCVLRLVPKEVANDEDEPIISQEEEFADEPLDAEEIQDELDAANEQLEEMDEEDLGLEDFEEGEE